MKSRRGMQSRLTNLLILRTRQYYLFRCDIFMRRMCMRICYVQLLLPTNTTAAELFKSLDDYISGKLDWSFCVSICMDGAAAITGQLSGLTTRIKDFAPGCESTHSQRKQRNAGQPKKCHLVLTAY
uniref:Uncharacterized protein n=1 Tax=Sander lucioperca TaxID=283035 RepID=A0A8D0D4L0_SANLU